MSEKACLTREKLPSVFFLFKYDKSLFSKARFILTLTLKGYWMDFLSILRYLKLWPKIDNCAKIVHTKE